MDTTAPRMELRVHSPRHQPPPGSQQLFAQLERAATVATGSRGEQLRACANSELLCRVDTGALAECAIRASGHRQIVDLILPNQCFFPSSRSDFYCEVIADRTRVTCFPRRRLEALADCDPRVGRVVRDFGRLTVARLQNQLLVLGQTTAQRKVAAFIAQLSDCLAQGPTDVLSLPLSRHDIADYLGISVETVCRAFTDLQRQRAIELTSARRVRIVNLQVLERHD